MATANHGPATAHDHGHDAHHDHKLSFAQRWLFSTNHKDIGTLYLIFSVFAAVIGVALSVLMRMELQSPGLQIFSDGQMWNAYVSAHGLIMVFFVVMPALIGGFGNWFVPMMIGAPDMAFPRHEQHLASGCWCRPSCCSMRQRCWWASGAGVGWTVYVPLSGSQYQPRPGHGHGASSRCTWRVPARSWGPINFITTIFNMRAPGMTLHKMPLFVWAMLVTAFLLLLAVPVLGGAITMLLTDRNFGTAFFRPEPAVATRCCSSTCSGSSATPKCTS